MGRRSISPTNKYYDNLSQPAIKGTPKGPNNLFGLPVNLDWKNLQLYFNNLYFKLSSYSIKNVGSKVVYGVWTTEGFVKFNKLTVCIVRIFSDQVSVCFTRLSKGFKAQER